jgi:serine phosphatase RsbU (regulator of sigma subunit)/Tfp pilus assembly protein PilF
MSSRKLIWLFLTLLSAQISIGQNTVLDSLQQRLEVLDDSDTNKVKVLHDITRILKSTDLPKAYDYAMQALKISSALNYENGRGQAFTDLGDLSYLHGNYDISISYHLQALKIYDDQNNLTGLASVENNIGAVYYAQGKLKEALKHYQSALVHYGSINDLIGIARVKNNLGNLYFSTNDLEKAKQFYQESLDLKMQLNDRNGLAMALNNLGNVFGMEGEFATSRDYFIRSLKISEELKDYYAVSMTLNNIGLLYQMEKDSSNALDYIRRSLEVAESIGAKDLMKDAHGAMVDVYEQFGDYKSALNAFKNYGALKDSLLNLESQKNINELVTKYDTEKKEQTIRLQHLEISAEKNFRNWIIGFGLLVVLIAFLLIKSNLDKKKANQLLLEQKHIIETKNDELEEKNKNILDSIHYASRIQHAILPPQELLRSQFPDSFVLWKPKDIVCGDFYWMETVDEITVFAVADCTGHGVPGAFMSIAGNNLLKEAVTVHGITEPAAILNEINRNLARMLHQDKKDATVRDGMDIALCAFDRKNASIKFSGAFNPMWLFRNGEWIEFAGDKCPVGSFEYMVPVSFTQKETTIQKGDTIYVFSDGFADQFGGDHGKKLKAAVFRKILLSIQHLDMQEQLQVIDTEFEKWRGQYEQIDDVCVLGIRF